jgi:hypothetical protein
MKENKPIISRVKKGLGNSGNLLLTAKFCGLYRGITNSLIYFYFTFFVIYAGHSGRAV